MYYYGYNPYRSVSYKKANYGDDRLVPFAGPFLLGALTGGVAVSAFNPYRPRPYYPPRPGYPVFF